MAELDLSGFFDPEEEQTRDVRLVVNGEPVERTVPVRRLLSDFLRHDLGLRGTHVGCEHGVCGACTVYVDGRTSRACLHLVVQCDGAEIRTIEGVSPAGPGELTPVQRAFRDCHGLQCGFCTPGYVIAVTEFVEEFGRVHGEAAGAAAAELGDDELREAISGNLCRCTGYQNIIAAARQALLESLAEASGAAAESAGEAS